MSLALGVRGARSGFVQTGLEEMSNDLEEADLWIASILARLLTFFSTASVLECVGSKLIG